MLIPRCLLRGCPRLPLLLVNTGVIAVFHIGKTVITFTFDILWAGLLRAGDCALDNNACHIWVWYLHTRVWLNAVCSQDFIGCIYSASVSSASCCQRVKGKKNQCEITFWGSLFTVWLFMNPLQLEEMKSTCSFLPGYVALCLQDFAASPHACVHAVQGGWVLSLFTLRGQALKPPWHTVLSLPPTVQYSAYTVCTSSRCIAIILAH